MQHREFQIGVDFWCNTLRWRCTDIGSRTIAAICLDRIQAASSVDGLPIRHLNMADADSEGWFKGPPYAVQEHVFDEESIIDYSSVPDEEIVIVMPTCKERIQLSPKTTARVWKAVRRGEAKDAEGYVMRMLNRALKDNKVRPTATPSSRPGDPSRHGHK